MTDQQALPNWVVDLVMDLQRESDEHPKLLFESGAFEGTRQYGWCPCDALKLVPADVQAQAAAVAAYRRQAERDKEPNDG